MKKNALITYFNNGDFKTIAEKQVMLKKLTEEFEAEGKELNVEANFTFGTISTFTDGSQIISMSIEGIGEEDIIQNLTHIYASQSLRAIPKGIETVYNKAVPLLVRGGQGDFDTSGLQLNFFSVENNSLKIN